jgi:choline dehydrogenase-like flavoprotein
MKDIVKSSYDVVVIGAGAGGAAAAWAYSQLGYSVCLVERGDWQDPSQYPSNFDDWERRRHSQYSYDPNIRNAAADYMIDHTSSPIKVANFNGVGGSTILYSGHFPRLHPSDFATFTLDAVGQDWPISYSQLEHYYHINDIHMGVSGLVGDTAYPPMREGSLKKPIPMGTYGDRLGQAFNELGWHWWPSYSAISSTYQDNRVPCQNVGPCNTGCPTGAKSSVDKTYIPKAIANGIELRVNTIAHTLISAGDEIEGVMVRHKGQEEALRAKITVLACNAIGTTRILGKFYQSCSSQIRAQMSDQIGHNLMMHPLGYVEGMLPADTDLDIGPQGCVIFSHQFYETQSDADFKRGYTMHILRGNNGVDGVSRGVNAGDISFGPSFISDVKNMQRRLANLTIICEDLPKRQNEVFLKNKIDTDGLPCVGVRYALDDNTKRMLNHGLKSGRKLLKKAGAKRVRATAPVSDAGWHLMGTARMGFSPEVSVTSPIGEVHGLSRLFVADGSLFTTSGGVNPASTIQALALYVADKSSQKYLGPRALKEKIPEELLRNR